MTMPGAPCVYYGDEIGLSGGGDPYCRAAFPWQNEAGWDKNLLAFYRSVIALRKAYPALQTGDYALLHSEGSLLAYSRRLGGQSVIAAFNAGGMPAQFSISAGALRNVPAEDFRVVWPGETQARMQVREGGLNLELPAQSGLVLAAGAL
jgi:neopullulanase